YYVCVRCDRRAPTAIYTLSLHDALPILDVGEGVSDAGEGDGGLLGVIDRLTFGQQRETGVSEGQESCPSAVGMVVGSTAVAADPLCGSAGAFCLPVLISLREFATAEELPFTGSERL